MTSPTTSDVHVNRPMTGMSIAFMSKLSKFQADNCAPIMPVDKKSDVYFKIDKEYFFQDRMRKRGVGAQAIRAGYGISQDSYLTDVWAVSKAIDDQVRANEDAPLNSDRNAMQFITRLERMNREKSYKTAFWNTGIWSTNWTGNASPSAYGSSTFNQWDGATSTPIDDVAAMKEVGEKLTGFEFNVMEIGAPVWKRLKTNPQILDRISGGSTNASPAQVTKQLVAQLFEIDELVVMSAVENTGAPGAAWAGDYIFGKHAWIGYRDATVGIETATAKRTITWKQYAGAKNGTRILKYRDENVHSDVIEVESAYVHKVISPELGLFLTDAVAS